MWHQQLASKLRVVAANLMCHKRPLVGRARCPGPSHNRGVAVGGCRVAYLDFYEALAAYLERNQGKVLAESPTDHRHPWQFNFFWSMALTFQAFFKHLLFGRSWDQVLLGTPGAILMWTAVLFPPDMARDARRQWCFVTHHSLPCAMGSQISKEHGLLLKTDHDHLNDTAGAILAKLVLDWLDDVNHQL